MMSVIAALLWTKSPRTSISTMIFDDENMIFLSTPTIQYFPKEYFRFRRAAKTSIKQFFLEIERIRKDNKQPVIIQYKIVFTAHGIPFLLPAKESKFVYQFFHKQAKKLKKSIKRVIIKPQLRKRLAGKSLKRFKKELRSLHLVSRKRERNFEYHLWVVALHATATTYAKSLIRLRAKLTAAMWNQTIQ